MATAIRHRCDDCGRADAVFEAQARRVKPGTTKETKGTLAPWDRRYLCEPCAQTAARSDDPPRKLTALVAEPKKRAAPAPNLTIADAFKELGT